MENSEHENKKESFLINQYKHIMPIPIHDRIIAKRVSVETVSKGGIFLGTFEGDEANDGVYGEVLFVGAGKNSENGLIPMTVKVGNVINFNDRASQKINRKGELIHILREADVYFIEDDPEVKTKAYTPESKSDFLGKAKFLG